MKTITALIKSAIVASLLLVSSKVTLAETQTAMTPTSIEIFTATDQPISAIDTFVEEHPAIGVQFHQLDAIKRLQARLSRGLSADPEQAKHVVLERLQRLSKATQRQLQRSATALAKAMQYGVEKYPAIVFDGELVVYGVSDLSVALRHYRHWHAGEAS